MSQESLLQETNSQERIMLFAPKGRLTLLTGGASVFLILFGRDCFETFLSFKGPWDTLLLLLWLLMTLVCALFVVLFLSLRFMPLLIITRQGLEDHSHCSLLFVTIRATWEEIALISAMNQGRTPEFRVALTVTGWQTFLARQQRFSRFLFRKMIPRLGDVYPIIVLPQLLLSIPARSVLAQIRAHFLPQLTAYGIVLEHDEL